MNKKNAKKKMADTTMGPPFQEFGQNKMSLNPLFRKDFNTLSPERQKTIKLAWSARSIKNIMDNKSLSNGDTIWTPRRLKALENSARHSKGRETHMKSSVVVEKVSGNDMGGALVGLSPSAVAPVVAAPVVADSLYEQSSSGETKDRDKFPQPPSAKQWQVAKRETNFGGRRTRHRRKHKRKKYKRKSRKKRKGRRKKGGHHELVLLAGAAGMKVYNSLTKKKRRKKRKRKTKRK